MGITKTHIYIVLCVIIALSLIAWYFFRAGKGKVTYVKPEIKNTQVGETQLQALAAQLHDDMKGLNWFGWNASIYKQAVLLNEPDLTNLYNVFNALYQSESKETLTSWLENETWDSEFVGETLKQKLISLGLR